jgi:Aldose 1-epimerase
MPCGSLSYFFGVSPARISTQRTLLPASQKTATPAALRAIILCLGNLNGGGAMGAGERISDLDARFGITGLARVTPGNGGLPRVAVTGAGAAGEMYLLGAEVTSWKPRGHDEVLFISAASKWEDGRAIRGGVPICFPWFGNKAGDPKAPAHGFVRATP